MSILDRFKKKSASESEKKPDTAGAVKQGKETKPAARGSSKRMFGVLLRAHVTEKTARQAKKNAYVFAVADLANKHIIKRAVEGKYGVSVLSVRTLKTHEKERRRGRIIGWKPGFKKAVVIIKEGQKIEIQ